MKKLNLLIALLVISFILSSCGDITNSDPNINTKVIQYNKVLANQVQSVIMPLKVGNRWIYRKENSKLDTTEVMSMLKINGEDWFNVKHIRMGNLFLTNTDVGLWYRCECETQSYLLAKYPINSNSFTTGFYYGIQLIEDSLGNYHTIIDTLYNEVKIENTVEVNVPKGKFTAILYKSNLKSINIVHYFTIDLYFYYVPDLGLIKLEEYYNGSISQTFELVDYTI
jgi:hypothetical protein